MFYRVRQRIAEVSAVAPRAYWYVWWGTLVNRLCGFVVPLLTIYLITVRHVSVSEAGQTVAVFGAGSLSASIVGGYLSDHLGRKATLLISLFGGAAAMACLGLAHELPAITVMVGIVGFVGELYRPAVMAIVADVVPAAQRVQAYGLLHWVINIGFAFAAIVGGLVAGIDFTLLFFADAATTAIFGAIILVAVPETRPRQIARAVVRPSRPWFADRELMVYVALTLGLAILPTQSVVLSAHMTRQGFSPAAFGGVIAVNGAMIIALQPTIAAWARHRDPTRVVAAAAMLYGAGFALHGLAGSVWMHGAVVMVWTLGEILESPTRSSIVAALAPPEARGRYQGAVAMTFGAAQLIGPTLGTWTWQHAGASTLWLACLGLGGAVALGMLATGPARRRRIAATYGRA